MPQGWSSELRGTRTQRHIQTCRHTDRQTDRHAHRERGRHTATRRHPPPHTQTRARTLSQASFSSPSPGPPVSRRGAAEAPPGPCAARVLLRPCCVSARPPERPQGRAGHTPHGGVQGSSSGCCSRVLCPGPPFLLLPRLFLSWEDDALAGRLSSASVTITRTL